MVGPPPPQKKFENTLLYMTIIMRTRGLPYFRDLAIEAIRVHVVLTSDESRAPEHHEIVKTLYLLLNY